MKQVVYQPRAYPGFCGMKRLWVFLLPLGGMQAHRRVTPSIRVANTHLYTWVERGTERVVSSAKTQHNVPIQGLNPDTLISWDDCDNHEATHLQQFTICLLQIFFWSEILCRLQSCTTKTSFASHCKSLEIRLLESKLKGRRWGRRRWEGEEMCIPQNFSQVHPQSNNTHNQIGCTQVHPRSNR